MVTWYIVTKLACKNASSALKQEIKVKLQKLPWDSVYKDDGELFKALEEIRSRGGKIKEIYSPVSLLISGCAGDHVAF